MKFNRWMMGLGLYASLFGSAFAADTTDITAEVPVGEEAPVPQDVPVSKQELMQQAADGDVAQPRIREFRKPNRMQMHASVANQKAGYGYLEENQRKPGVVKLKSGLQYRVLVAGAGAKPTDADIVNCRYKGSLIDGTVFEQSFGDKPASVKIASLIPGLEEALKLMPVGSKWQVYIPPQLGFGSAGKPPKVGPEAVLIYDIELLSVAATGTR